MLSAACEDFWSLVKKLAFVSMAFVSSRVYQHQMIITVKAKQHQQQQYSLVLEACELFGNSVECKCSDLPLD